MDSETKNEYGILVEKSGKRSPWTSKPKQEDKTEKYLTELQWLSKGQRSVMCLWYSKSVFTADVTTTTQTVI
jgi:hypothetical protein